MSFNKYIYHHLNQDIEYDNYLKSPLGILLTVMWQTGWEGSLGENGYIYMCGWVPLLSAWNYHNIVNRLYSN